MNWDERVVVIVDLENACGGSALVPANQKKVREIVGRLHVGSPPLVIYSTGPLAPRLAPNLLWEWSPARYVPGTGLDGADNALIKVMRHEPIAARSTRVFLVSGDHAFVEPVEELRRRGIPTTVVANPRGLSRRLSSVADEVRWLPEFGLTRSGLRGVISINSRGAA